MALKRLQKDEVYRFYLASKLAFEDWENPTTAELNANPTNDPNGLSGTCPVRLTRTRLSSTLTSRIPTTP